MHYSSRAFAVGSNFTILPNDPSISRYRLGQREGFTILDLAHINIRYCNGMLIDILQYIKLGGYGRIESLGMRLCIRCACALAHKHAEIEFLLFNISKNNFVHVHILYYHIMYIHVSIILVSFYVIT